MDSILLSAQADSLGQFAWGKTLSSNGKGQNQKRTVNGQGFLDLWLSMMTLLEYPPGIHHNSDNFSYSFF